MAVPTFAWEGLHTQRVAAGDRGIDLPGLTQFTSISWGAPSATSWRASLAVL